MVKQLVWLTSLHGWQLQPACFTIRYGWSSCFLDQPPWLTKGMVNQPSLYVYQPACLTKRVLLSQYCYDMYLPFSFRLLRFDIFCFVSMLFRSQKSLFRFEAIFCFLFGSFRFSAKWATSRIFEGFLRKSPTVYRLNLCNKFCRGSPTPSDNV